MAWTFFALAILAELAGTLGLRGVTGSPAWWSVGLIAVAYGPRSGGWRSRCARSTSASVHHG